MGTLPDSLLVSEHQLEHFAGMAMRTSCNSTGKLPIVWMGLNMCS